MISKKKKSKPKEAIGRNAAIPEGIYGNTRKDKGDRKPTVLTTTKKKRVSSARSKRRSPVEQQSGAAETQVIPNLDIDYNTSKMPKDASKIDPNLLRNVIEIPEHLLLLMKSGSESRAKNYSEYLLRDIMPTALALDAGHNYVRTALHDGMGIEVDIDDSIGEAIKNLIRLDTIVFYLKRMKQLPLKYKRQFLSHLVEKMADDCIVKMDKEQNHQRKTDKFLKDLEGVVVRGFSQKKNAEAKIRERAGPQEKESSPIVKQDSGIVGNRPAGAIRKPRR